jgi:pilus assembly protein CpaE
VDLGIPRNRFEIVVNRFQAGAQITLRDIANTLSCERVIAIPNDFRAVSESLNSATPLHVIASSKAITRALHQLSQSLTGTTPTSRPGMLARLRSWF